MTPDAKGLAESLRSWAQNEEMIDSSFLKHGRDCNEAADLIESLVARRTEVGPCCFKEGTGWCEAHGQYANSSAHCQGMLAAPSSGPTGMKSYAGSCRMVEKRRPDDPSGPSLAWFCEEHQSFACDAAPAPRGEPAILGAPVVGGPAFLRAMSAPPPSPANDVDMVPILRGTLSDIVNYAHKGKVPEPWMVEVLERALKENGNG